MFKETNDGQTHSENDGCGEPLHNSPKQAESHQSPVKEVSKEFPQGKEAYCPQCYCTQCYFDDDLTILRTECIHAKPLCQPTPVREEPKDLDIVFLKENSKECIRCGISSFDHYHQLGKKPNEFVRIEPPISKQGMWEEEFLNGQVSRNKLNPEQRQWVMLEIRKILSSQQTEILGRVAEAVGKMRKHVDPRNGTYAENRRFNLVLEEVLSLLQELKEKQ